MKDLVKKIFVRGRDFYYRLGVAITLAIMSSTAVANIPAAPNVPGGSTTDYIKTGQSVADEVLKIGITILYVGAIIGYCSGILWLLMQAKKTKEWGNFFKGAGIGLGVLVLILILLNQAKTALGAG